MFRVYALPVAAVLAALAGGAASGENVTVTTLDWPPYTSPELPRGGATTAVVDSIFEAAGMEAQVVTLPWKRAIAMAKNDPAAVGYFPGYHCRHVDGFIASDPIGNGPLGFAENAEAPVTWESIDELGEEKYRIGTVLGYANTDEFDEKAGTGWIRALPAKDDLTNLRKLALQRIDLAVIDKLVLSYLLATEPSLEAAKDDLRFDEKPLAEKTLYMCFTDDEAGHALRERFNEALATVEVGQIVSAYFEEEF